MLIYVTIHCLRLRSNAQPQKDVNPMSRRCWVCPPFFLWVRLHRAVVIDYLNDLSHLYSWVIWTYEGISPVLQHLPACIQEGNIKLWKVLTPFCWHSYQCKINQTITYHWCWQTVAVTEAVRGDDLSVLCAWRGKVDQTAITVQRPLPPRHETLVSREWVLLLICLLIGIYIDQFLLGFIYIYI